jgi:hypothetical protein
VFPLLFRVLLFAARSKRGRRLLVLGALSGMRLVRSPTARMAYVNVWRIATDPRSRKQAGAVVRTAARRKRR